MKFNEMTYTRPDIDALLAECKQLAAKAAAADSDEAIVETYYEQSRAFADYTTASNLANIHYTATPVTPTGKPSRISLTPTVLLSPTPAWRSAARSSPTPMWTP